MGQELEGVSSRIAIVEDRLSRIEKALESIDATLRTLARIEYQNDAMERRVSSLETDMRSMRDEMPTLKLARAGWFDMTKTVLLAVLGAALAYIGLKAK